MIYYENITCNHKSVTTNFILKTYSKLKFFHRVTVKTLSFPRDQNHECILPILIEKLQTIFINNLLWKFSNIEETFW